MNNVIALDPGNRTGWAVFRERILYEAGVGHFKDVFQALPSEPDLEPAFVLIELPRHYPHRTKGDVNDLLDLAARAGELRGAYLKKSWVIEARYVFPRNWKGTVPKPVHNARTIAKLNALELAILPKKRADARRKSSTQDYDHNMLDAVGLGLWAVDR